MHLEDDLGVAASSPHPADMTEWPLESGGGGGHAWNHIVNRCLGRGGGETALATRGSSARGNQCERLGSAAPLYLHNDTMMHRVPPVQSETGFAVGYLPPPLFLFLLLIIIIIILHFLLFILLLNPPAFLAFCCHILLSTTCHPLTEPFVWACASAKPRIE